MSTPRLSVLMTVYNGGPFLRPAVESVLASSMGDLEFVVVDNVSTDGSREWLRTLTDPRLRLLENDTNLGQTGALRRGLEACRAPVVARLDADDLSEPDRFGRQLAVLDGNDRMVLVGGQALQIDASGTPFARTSLPVCAEDAAAVMVVANPFIHSCAMFRREPALAVGGYCADFAVAQDYALWSALLRAGWGLCNLPHVVARLRCHPGQVTASALGSREFGEALAVTALNQAWALGLDQPDRGLARTLQRLWLGQSAAPSEGADPDAVAALNRILLAPKLTSAGQARLAMLLAAAPLDGLANQRFALVLRAGRANPSSLMGMEAVKVLLKSLLPTAALSCLRKWARR